MKGKDFYFDFFKKILSHKKGEEIFVIFLYEKNEITRYSKSKIHQNTSYENTEVAVSIKEKDRIVTRFFSNPELDDAKNLVNKTYEMLKDTYPSDYPGYPEGSNYREIFTFDEMTFNVSEEERALAVYRISKILGNFEGYGVINTGGSEIALFSSRGLSAYSKVSDAHVTITAMKGTATGWAEEHSRRFSQIDFEKIAEEAKFKAANSFDKIQIEPGEYVVFLEPEAVADIFVFASFIGFSAKTYQEKRNFLVGRLGEKVFSDKLTIYEDPFFEDGFPFPFDFEGVPKEKVEIVSKGVAKNLLYDRKTAFVENKKSTGNAAGFPPSTFPFPFNLVISPGEKGKDEILSEIERGIYISRFHYTNIVNASNFSITGMTRDGTFLIEKGKITKPIKNLRFTDSFLRVLSNELEVSKERKLISESSSYGFRFSTGIYAPYLLCSLRFTSYTDF
ncbi:MAG: TldD/PmbA family protein [Candidatus Hydrothermales bacterium]